MENKGFLKRGWQWFARLTKVKKALLALPVLLAFFLVRLPVTFTVLDAGTRKPIEGAVAIAMWYETKGLPGLSSTYISKAVEAVSDKNGTLRFPFLFGRAAIYKPHVKVYKAGYVGWDSKKIYLGCYKDNPKVEKTKKREIFAMRSQDIFLESWKNQYTFISHHYQIMIPPGVLDAGIKQSKYEAAIRYEAPLREEERRVYSK